MYTNIHTTRFGEPSPTDSRLPGPHRAPSEITISLGSRIHWRFEGPKSRCEKTMNKLDHKFAKSPTQWKKRAAVISLRNSLFRIPARSAVFFSRQTRADRPICSRALLVAGIWSENFRTFSRKLEMAVVKKLGSLRTRICALQRGVGKRGSVRGHVQSGIVHQAQAILRPERFGCPTKLCRRRGRKRL